MIRLIINRNWVRRQGLDDPDFGALTRKSWEYFRKLSEEISGTRELGLMTCKTTASLRPARTHFSPFFRKYSGHVFRRTNDDEDLRL